MKKVLFVLKNMNLGGVEQSLLSLLSTLNCEQYSVDLMLMEKKGALLESVPEWVNVITFPDFEEIGKELDGSPYEAISDHFIHMRLPRAAKLLTSYVKYKMTGDYEQYCKGVFSKCKLLAAKYDIAVAYSSMIGYLTWIVNNLVTAERKIGWIHFEIDKTHFDKQFTLSQHQKLDKIYIVSPSSYDVFVKLFPELESKCEIRYNVVDRNRITRMSLETADTIREDGYFTIVTLGRLTNQKRQDIIPEIVCKLKCKGYKIKWFLVGEGGLRGKIENRAAELGVENEVILLGAKTNPYPYLKQADIYVQPSEYEGYCIALAEALVFNLPCVTTDFSGAHEQLDGRDNCYITNLDADELAGAIEKVIDNLTGKQK